MSRSNAEQDARVIAGKPAYAIELVDQGIYSIVELKNGNLLANNGRLSRDRGRTWEKPKPLAEHLSSKTTSSIGTGIGSGIGSGRKSTSDRPPPHRPRAVAPLCAHSTTGAGHTPITRVTRAQTAIVASTQRSRTISAPTRSPPASSRRYIWTTIRK